MRKLFLTYIVCCSSFLTLGQSMVFTDRKEVVKSKHFYQFDHRIKLGMFDFLRGNVFLYYEYLLGSQHALEFGVAPTFSDVIPMVIASSEIAKMSTMKDTRFALSLMYKIRPFKKVSFLYLGLGAKFRSYYTSNFNNPYVDKYSSYVGKKTRAKQELQPTLKIGNYFAPSGKRFIIEYAVGIGYIANFIRSTSGKINYDSNGISSGITKTSSRYNEYQWMVALEFKFGFGLGRRN